MRDSNPRRRCQLIYSQIPLAAWVTSLVGLLLNKQLFKNNLTRWAKITLMADSSFDIVSKVDKMEADNALNQAIKEVEQRYDFKGVGASIAWSGEKILMKASSEERVKAVLDVFQSKLVKRGISLKSFVAGEPFASGKEYRLEGELKNGIEQEQAKKISKIIREEGPKSVKSQIQGDELRVQSKSRDDLQEVMSLLRGSDLDIDIQFTNYR